MNDCPETLKMWRFSTDNVSPDDEKLLEVAAENSIAGYPYIMKHDRGFHVLVDEYYCPLHRDFSIEFRKIYDRASSEGIAWLDIDCDAALFTGARDFYAYDDEDFDDEDFGDDDD